LLFTNSTVSPLATVILLGCARRREEGEEVSFCFQSFVFAKKTRLAELDSREMTRVVRKLTCHSADEARCARWHRRLRCRGDRARTNARAEKRERR